MTEYEKTEQAYKNGYAKGFEDGKPKWIPVTERLPEDGETVLVYGRRGGIYTAWCNRRYSNVGWHKLNSKSHHCDPTHWMPLPDAPKEGK